MRDGAGIVLVLEQGSALNILTGDLERITPTVVAAPEVRLSASGWFEDVNRTRYFYSPSAMMLKRGTLSFSQKELALSLLSYGATDFLSLQLGSALPAFFAGLNGLNVLMAAKIGGSVTQWFHLAGGIQSVILPGLSVAGASGGLPLFGVGFATVTLGHGDRHASLSAGVPFTISAAGRSPFTAPIFTLSGNWRVTESLAVVTEHWVVLGIAGPQSYGLLNGAGVRFLGQRLAVDVGFVLASQIQPFSGFTFAVPFPIPWLDVTYTFF